MPEAWKTFEQVMEHLQVRRTTLKWWIRTKRFPVYKPGQFRFRLSEVERWMEKHRQRSVEP